MVLLVPLVLAVSVVSSATGGNHSVSETIYPLRFDFLNQGLHPLLVFYPPRILE